MGRDKRKLKVTDWLQNLEYDGYGAQIWSVQNGGYQHIVDVRGWGAIQNLVVDKPEKFQNDVGEFIVEAIREKVERGEYLQTELRKP